MALGRHHTPMPAGGGIHPISSILALVFILKSQLLLSLQARAPRRMPLSKVDLLIFFLGMTSAKNELGSNLNFHERLRLRGPNEVVKDGESEVSDFAL